MTTTRTLSLRKGMFKVEILEAGSGPDVLYLHGIWDATETDFIERLGEHFHVIAPRHPGFGQSTGEEQLIEIFDMTYYYADLVDALDLQRTPIVGHCLGGMFAAELAATQPQRFPKLALIAPFGLWDEQHPALDFFATGQTELAAALYGPKSPQAVEAAAPAKPPAGEPTPEETEARIREAVERAKAMSVAARFLWPLPNRGLTKRAHRVTMPTLLVWGREDGILPLAYGTDFQKLIPGSTLETLPGGHLVHHQATDAVTKLLHAFL